MKSVTSASSKTAAPEVSEPVAAVPPKSSDAALAVKVFLIAALFIGAIWLLDRLASGG